MTFGVPGDQKQFKVRKKKKKVFQGNFEEVLFPKIF